MKVYKLTQLLNEAKKLSKQEVDALFDRARDGDMTLLDDPNIGLYNPRYETTPLHKLAWRDKIDVTKLLKHPLIDKVLDKEGRLPLHHLASKSNLSKENVKTILENPVILKAKDKRTESTPLHNLAYAGYEEVLDHPKSEIIRNRSGETPLEGFVKNGLDKLRFDIKLHKIYEPAINRILKHSSLLKQSQKDKSTLLHHLASKGIEAVLDHPDIAVLKDTDGKTPLHYFARSGGPRLQKLMLKHPKVAEVQDNDGNTPLHDITNFNYEDKKSLEKHIALNHPMADKVQNNKGETPLHLYAKYAHLHKGERELIKHPSISKIKDNEGNTPLHLMANDDYDGVILDHLDIDLVKNDDNKTPLDILVSPQSEYARHREIFGKVEKETLLKKHRAKDLKKIKFQPLTKKIDLD